MNCDETRRLLDADIDGELDLVRHLDIEEHLRTCAACAVLAANARARRAALQQHLPRFAAPASLAEKIRASLSAASPAPAPSVAERVSVSSPLPSSVAERVSVSPPPSSPAATARTGLVFPLWQLTGLAASLTLAALFGYAWGTARTRSNQLVAEAVSAHVRSLQVDHLTDVTSTDQHTVKPWFAGKLDFSPPVIDLASAGFPLVGGRLEEVDQHLAAALVFRRRQHAINLFIWPAAARPVRSQSSDREGYHLTSWTQADLNFLAVSEIPAPELTQFANAFRAAVK